MQEFIFTLVVIYVLFRVFGKSARVYHVNHYHHQDPSQKRPDGKLRVDTKPKSNSDGEFTDYEEIK